MTINPKRVIGLHAPDWLLPGCVILGTWTLAIRQLDLEWSINPEYQYGWIVPFLTLLLWRQAWLRRPDPDNRGPLKMLPFLVVLLAMLALPLRIIEEANPDWRPLNEYYAGQAILITTLVVYCSGGRAWLRHFTFPLLFPLIAVPWPSGIEADIIQGLQRTIASIGVEGASWAGWSAVQRGSLIVLSQGVVGINEACSGIRSLQSSLMISLFLGAYFQLTTLKRWGLIVLALILAFVLNAVRAFLLIAVMEMHGTDAMLKFHDPAGFGIATVSLVVLWIVSSFLTVPETAAITPARQTRGAFWFPPRWSLVLLGAWVAIEGLNAAWYQWREQDAVPGPIWTLQWPPPRPDFKEDKITDEAKIYLHYNEGMHGEWNDQYHWEVFFFTWKPSRAAAGLATFHRPDICLPAAGYIMKEDLGLKNLKIKGLDLPVNRYVFEDPFTGRLFYLFQAVTDDRIGKHVIKWETNVPDSFNRLQAAWEGWRNPGQRSLLVVNQGARNIDEAELGLQSLLNDSLVISSEPSTMP